MQATCLRSPGPRHLNIHRSYCLRRRRRLSELALQKFPLRVCAEYVCIKSRGTRVRLTRIHTTVRHKAADLNEAHSSGHYRGDRVIVSPRGGSHLIIIPHIPKPAIMVSRCASRSPPRCVSCFPRSISRCFLKASTVV